MKLLLSRYKVSVRSDDKFWKQLVERVVPHCECRLNLCHCVRRLETVMMANFIYI